ncbi:uncharacterized protein LOC114928246 [Nylanderia fulva]|uniref:uncharacterized protein LOC114928246 n=1 Tax=Nylanderia fulva TaxID=613905 RepID=UPI0010FB4631|nr:uncharacterized protein LOC114928246 [Nylanderia fulva]
MSELISAQQALLHSVARSLDNFKKIGKNNLTSAKVRSRVSTLKETWSQCLQTHTALIHAIPEAKRETMDYFKKQQLDDYEDIYQNTLDYMAECLEAIEPTANANSSFGSAVSKRDESFSLSHLPPILIPPFSGKCEDWENFRDRFTSLIIMNKDLSNFARMHFLVSSFTGRALESIKNTPITADNFEIAWKALVSRYKNKRRLIEVHVSALYNMPTVSRENAFELNELRDKANRALASLKTLNRTPAEILSDMLVYCVSQKLDHSTRKAWKLRGSDNSDIPTYEDLDRFISSRARALEELTPLSLTKPTRSQKINSNTASASSAASCPVCKGSHFINKCALFIQKTPTQRLEIVKQAKRCVNCLSAKHAVQACPSKYSCRACQRKHHSMLHLESSPSATETVLPTTSKSKSEMMTDNATSLFSASRLQSRPSVLLATARVKIGSPSGRTVIARALLDQGSEITFITEQIVQTLKLRRIKLPISISAVGGVDAGTCRFAAQIKLSPRDVSYPTLTSTASIMHSLTKYTPPLISSTSDWNHLSDLTLADPDPTSPDRIDIIIGADLYSKLIVDGVRRGDKGTPLAQNTIFGWILLGPMSGISLRRSISVQHCANALSLESELRRFWEIEEIPQRAILSPEEQQCEEHFLTTHSRCADGRYVVRLPFRKGPPIDIGQSRNTAERLLKSVHRRFKSSNELKIEYTKFLHEYEALGHMREVTSSRAFSMQCVYIPHHPVIRESSVTTRLRVVFNASSITTNSTSLNDHLLTGPKLQTDLSAVVLRWRQFRYVYSADIAKMYRQISVDSRDVDYQRILWADSETECAKEYQLTTVTYGTASAPFLALRVLRQLILDEGHSFPLAVPVLQDNIYVDDVLFGADDIPLLRQMRSQVCALLKCGLFELRKWSSNSVHLLNDIAVEDHGLACNKPLQFDEQLKILGISWNPASDIFRFNVSFPIVDVTTKRSILSAIAKFFDPLGWSTPVTINAKIFLQKLWQCKLEWGDQLPPPLLDQWNVLQTSLTEVNGLQLNRWIQRGSDTVHCELHGFSDASNAAYAAAVYMRIISLSGEINVNLLMSKSKVAPVKTLSIPRLELSAALLMARLIEFVRNSLHIPDVPCYCWTDSTIVLAWVNQHPSRWKTFVSNRVSQIQTRIPSAKWRHISTHENPADCASRGISGHSLASHTLWWRGPEWLLMPSSEWPTQTDPLVHETELDQKSHVLSHLMRSVEPWDLASRYSSWTKLIRITAYVMRYIHRLRHPIVLRQRFKTNSAALTADECQKAKEFWLKRIQENVFPLERDALLNNQKISSRSALLTLNPFIGDDQLIRVGGRLSHASIPFTAKHPVILASHPLIKLIIRHAHLRSLHAGTQLTLATLQQEFWILRARTLIKSVIHQCVACTREKAVHPVQLMGNLPSVRVNAPTRAFLHCRLDYAGPVSLRALSGRGRSATKAYIALFVCMASRAVHLEVVDGYSTSAFLGAYARFCARRGLPESIYSDNGTTFVGADRELAAAFRATLRDPNLLNRTASEKVQWHFLPPSSPHFGGL